jgi:hypothetical protein
MWWVAPVAIGLWFFGKRIFVADYERGYGHGRAGDPMELGHASCWVSNPDTYNRDLESDYCRGFFDGQEDRANGGYGESHYNP